MDNEEYVHANKNEIWFDEKKRTWNWYIPEEISKEEREIVEFAIVAYQHMLEKPIITYGKFADAIEEFYDLINPVNFSIHDTLLKMERLTNDT